jgi:hypothetical protein
MERSGYYLEVVPLSSFEDRVSTAFKNSILEKCPLKLVRDCNITLQYEFNPANFLSDYSDYYGTGAKGYPALNKLGQPRVIYFTNGGSGNIAAWYTYPGLQKTIFYSPNMLYSYSGVYSPVIEGGEEYSNAYIPRVDLAEFPFLKTVPITYFNYGSGGLRIGTHLRYKSTAKPIDPRSNNIIEIYQVMQPDKYKCFQNLALVVDNDLLFSNSGLKPIDLSDVEVKPGTPTNNDGSMTNFNPGEYCQEKWCVADTTPLVHNQTFASDGNNESLKFKIANYISGYTRNTAGKNTVILQSRYAGLAGNTSSICRDALPTTASSSPNYLSDRIYCKVDYMCKQAAAEGIPCAFLAGLWLQESTFELSDNNDGDPNFGCFILSYYTGQRDLARKNGNTAEEARYQALMNTWYKFDVQVRCAVGSILTSYDYMAKGVELSGPGSIYTPNYDKFVQSPSGGLVLNEQGYPIVKTGQTVTGSCKPATLFSMIMQRYTPSDTRIDFDNQCNTGLVHRTDQGLRGCTSNIHRPAGSNSTTDPYVKKGATKFAWPIGEFLEGKDASRPNLYKAITDLDADRIHTTDSCFPNNASSPTPTNAKIDEVLKQYDLEPASNKGIYRMNLGQWGNSWAAGNVQMALHGMDSVQESEFDANPDKRKAIGGLHVVNPGQSFSFNDKLGNPDEEAVKLKYSSYGDYDFTGAKVVGGGWCELATTINVAASRAKVLKNGQVTEALPSTKFTSPGQAGLDPTQGYYGTGGGRIGSINNWQHSGGLDLFNNVAVDGDKLTDLSRWTAIVTRPGNKDGFKDGDLTIKNTTDKYMFILVDFEKDRNNIIQVEVFFGTKKDPNVTTTPIDTNTSPTPIPDFVNYNVGKGKPIPNAANFVPSNLVELAVEPNSSEWSKDSSNTGIALSKNPKISGYSGIVSDLDALIKAAESAGFKNESRLHVVSGYRSYADQKAALERGGNETVATPGESEHQLGTAVDIMPRNESISTDSDIQKLYNNQKFITWMEQNAGRYNFKISYPKGNTDYDFEPWHLRWKP